MNAYVTLADSIEYLKCAYALALSLQKVNSAYPLVIMIPDNTIEYNEFPKMDNVYFKIIPQLMFNAVDALGDFNTTINKFFCIGLEEYDKVIFLDSDVYIYENIDRFFDYKFPLTSLREDIVSICGELFGFKTDISLLGLILNLNIRYNFCTDEEVLNYLYNKEYLPIGTLVEEDILYHDGGSPKMWASYSFDEILHINKTQNIRNLFLNFKKEKQPHFYSRQLQINYMSNTLKKIKEKYETI